MLLAPLDVAQTANMVSSMLEAEPVSETFARLLHQHADELPLALEESVRLLCARADLIRRDGEWVRRRLEKIAVSHVLSVPVTMTVTPPKTWGKITGTVVDSSTGNPVAGATVQVCTLYDPSTGSCGAGSQTYTLTTDANGDYGLWLDRQSNPLRVTVSDTGYVPQVKTAKITAGRTTTVNVALKQT